ncbi:MAG TPA: glycosyltransferase [Gemmatimonadaceae bacterium]|nr:glycosyltransferase [Gemmatimonadaceae bacterium]
MRVLIIGSNNPWRMEAAVERALLRAGHDTLIVDDRRVKRLIGRRLTQRWALRQAERFAADFVFLSKCLALDPETVSHIVERKSNAMWYHDPQWHADLDRPDIAHIATIGRLSRIFFVTGFEDEWRRIGLPAAFLPAAGDSGIHPVPRDSQFASDIAFIGTGYDPERTRLLLQVAARHDLRVWGPGWEEWKSQLKWTGRSVEGRDFAAVCSSSAITLGINPARAAGGVNYTSDRTWMVMLAGGFYLAQRTPGIAAMLRDEEHCAFYDDVESCLAQCERYLADTAARDRIRTAGERYVRDNHTYDQRIANLLEGRAYMNPLAAS